MAVDLATVRGLMRNASPNITLLIAPDVYENIAAGAPLEEAALKAVARGITIKLGPDTMERGTVIVMHSAEFKPPEDGWAARFLNKSGPVPAGSLAPYDPAGTGMMSAKPPKPAPPTVPPPAPKPPITPKPRPRQRIVDT
jgi:hypothetical protein